MRRIYDEWAQGNFSGGREIFDPNVEGVWTAELPDTHVDQGAEALAASSRDWLSAWEGFRVEAEAFLPFGDKVVVLVVLRGSARAAASKLRPPSRTFGR